MCPDPPRALNLAWAVEKASRAFSFIAKNAGFCFLLCRQRCFQPRGTQSSISTYSPDTALCQTRQDDALYQPLNFIYVPGRSPTRKISPLHPFPHLLLFGKATLNEKNKHIWGSCSWRWKDTEKRAGPRTMVMVKKRGQFV